MPRIGAIFLITAAFVVFSPRLAYLLPVVTQGRFDPPGEVFGMGGAARESLTA
jgi:hypothetical protein